MSGTPAPREPHAVLLALGGTLACAALGFVLTAVLGGVAAGLNALAGLCARWIAP